MMSTQRHLVIFGEVLFDEFPGNKTEMGGAPFNVAWHLTQFQQDTVFISGVGQDELGQEILTLCEKYNFSTAGIQRNERPTGKVSVTFDDGQPSYAILDHQAYDDLDLTQAGEVAPSSKPTIMYHGSLALRHQTNKDIVAHLQQGDVETFVDVNLRDPWWEKSDVIQMLMAADHVKLNDEELELLTDWRPGDAVQEACVDIQSKFNLKTIIVTCGSEGVHYQSERDGYGFVAAPKVDKVVATVGAGDSVSAVSILGMNLGWSWNKTLRAATQFAARICEQQGATISDPGTYKLLLDRWSSMTD